MDEYTENEDIGVFNEEIVFNIKSKTPPSSNQIQERKNMNDQSFKYIPELRKKKISPERREYLMEKFSQVVVHDYGPKDDYNLSEKEREEKSQYYEVFSKIMRCKRKYRKLPEFIRVYRLCIDCLFTVAEKNGVYEPNKFIKMVLDKKIHVNGLNFPKYIGKNKKDVGWELVTEYIMNRDLDPDDFKKHDSESICYEHNIISDTDYEDMVNNIIDLSSNCNSRYFKGSKDFDDVAVAVSDKDAKKFIKISPSIIKTLKQIHSDERKRELANRCVRQYQNELIDDDMCEIERIDTLRGYTSESDIPEFHGDILKRSDRLKYENEINEYEMNQIRTVYNGKLLTQNQINEIELKDALEAAGWNIRAMSRNREREKKLKKAYKRDREREKKLKKELLSTQMRLENREGIRMNSKKRKSKGKKKKKEKD